MATADGRGRRAETRKRRSWQVTRSAEAQTAPRAHLLAQAVHIHAAGQHANAARSQTHAQQ
eukprot:8064039-Alexandrium_andersonii.AAC.1